VLEGAWRLYFARNPAHAVVLEEDGVTYADPMGIRRMMPGQVGCHCMWDGSGPALVRVNSLGLRGGEISPEKAEGVTRVLFLGDSVTMGWQVNVEDTFVFCVGSSFEAAFPGRFETVNAGHNDTGLEEHERLLEELVGPVRPDVVVLVWYLNDGRPPNGFRGESGQTHPVVGWLRDNPLVRHSYLAGFLYARYVRQRVASEIRASSDATRFQYSREFEAANWLDDPSAFKNLVRLARFDWGNAWEEESLTAMFGRIERMARAAARHGARFVVVATPATPQVFAEPFSEYVAQPQLALAQFCRQQSIPFLDLLPLFRGQRRAGLFIDQCHLTPDGHRLACGWIRDFLLSVSGGGTQPGTVGQGTLQRERS
jgi:lysophospholipase L1-like esterase